MNFQNSTQAYLRPAPKIGFRQQFNFRDILDLPGGLVLWKPIGKIALVIVPLVLIINTLVASAIGNIDRSIKIVDDTHHELMDKNIEMLAAKAWMWAPDHIQELAEEKLSLYAVSKKQVGKFSKRKGTFIYL